MADDGARAAAGDRVGGKQRADTSGTEVESNGWSSEFSSRPNSQIAGVAASAGSSEPCEPRSVGAVSTGRVLSAPRLLDQANVALTEARSAHSSGRISDMKRLARFAAAAAALVAATTLASFPPQPTTGYSTAKECHDGSGCGSMPVLLDCLDCCLDNCNYNNFLSGCSDICTGDNEKAYAGVIRASRVLRADWSDQSPGAVTVLVACARSSNPRVSSLARKVAQEFPAVVAALKYSERPA